MNNRLTTLLMVCSLALALAPISIQAQDGLGQNAEHAEDMTAATMIMADDLEFAALEVPGFDSGMEFAALYGDFTAEGPYALRLSFPDGYRFPAHFHPMDENLTVISGTLLLAMGDTVDESQLVGYGPGDFLNLPAEHPHFGGATGYTVIQLHGDGPFEILLVE